MNCQAHAIMAHKSASINVVALSFITVSKRTIQLAFYYYLNVLVAFPSYKYFRVTHEKKPG